MKVQVTKVHDWDFNKIEEVAETDFFSFMKKLAETEKHSNFAISLDPDNQTCAVQVMIHDDYLELKDL